MSTSFELISINDMNFQEVINKSEVYFGIKFHKASETYAIAVDKNREMMLTITPKALSFTIFNMDNVNNIVQEVCQFVLTNFKNNLFGLKYDCFIKDKIDDFYKIDSVRIIS